MVTRALSREYGISLSLPMFPGPPEGRLALLKKFCEGFISGEAHPWRVCAFTLSKRERYSIAHTLFLFRKILPSTEPDLQKLLNKVSAESPDPDPEFMAFLRKEIPKLFRYGWDKNYEKKVNSTVVSTSACSEVSREDGGNRAYFLDLFKEEARTEFCKYLRGEEQVPPVPPSKLISVETGGKYRVLTKSPAFYSLLRPLHHCMYDHLSRFSWLLRGDANVNRFRDFVRVDGELFVSGDYVSATDNLNSHIQKEILRLLLQNCNHVPNSIRILAMQSMSQELSLDDGVSPPRIERLRSGQMMGSLLSFPLLCIVNYMAFRYSTRDLSIPVKVNGDDIVFRAKPDVIDRWKKNISASGLELSAGKTMVDKSIFTLNSTLFYAKYSKVHLLPFIRSKALFGTEDGVNSLPGRYQSFYVGAPGPSRDYWRSVFLRQNIGFIETAGRSLNRGLGMDVPSNVLRNCMLWTRECSYLSLPKESAPPLPKSLWASLPTGYTIEHSEKKYIYTEEEKNELSEALIQCSWRVPDWFDDFSRREQLAEQNLESRALRSLRPVSISWTPRRGRLLGLKRTDWQDMIQARNRMIFDDYTSRKRKLYPYFKKSKLTVPAYDGTKENEKPVPPIELGGATVYDCRPVEPKLCIYSAGAKVKIFRRGVGIGPPTCF